MTEKADKLIHVMQVFQMLSVLDDRRRMMDEVRAEALAILAEQDSTLIDESLDNPNQDETDPAHEL